MREFIDLLERKTMVAHKPFDQVTDIDIIRSLFDIDDLRDVAYNYWNDIDFGVDEHDAVVNHPFPHSSADLTDEMIGYIRSDFLSLLTRAREDVSPVAKLPEIVVHRYLNRLSDLTKPIGVHWSYGGDLDMGRQFGEHLVQGVVANKNVDWVTTLARAMFFWHEEQEITPVEGSPIKLTSLHFGEDAYAKA